MTHINARYLAGIMDISAEELLALSFYDALLDLHCNYDERKLSDTEYAAAMDSIIVANPGYAENLTHLKVRLLAHI